MIRKISVSLLRSLTVLTLLALGAGSAQAQNTFTLSGQVFAIDGQDSIPLDRQWVVLHEVTIEAGGPVDSVLTDRSGSYLVESLGWDTTALYLASTTYGGITYFTVPVEATEFNLATAETLFVFDTSSTAPPIIIKQRHVVVQALAADGTRPVLELLVLENRGTLTRIAGAEGLPVWSNTLPTDAIGFEVGEGDVSPEAVTRRGEDVVVIAPIPPGEKRVVFAYALPGEIREVNIPIGHPTDRLQVLLEDPEATVTGSILTAMGSESLEDMTFSRFEGMNVQPAQSVVLQFPRAPLQVTDLWWVVVVAAALGLAVGIVAVVRQRQPVAVLTEDPEQLAAQIAALDYSFEHRSDVSDEERATYRNTRAQLKARLSQAIARSEPKG